MALITIDGVAMPQPNKYAFPMTDMIGEDLYNEEGELFRDYVRNGIAGLDLSWVVTGEETNIILPAVEKDSVEVTYLDPKTNTFTTSRMCVGDRSCELISYNEAEPQKSLWSIGFNLTQY